MFNRLSDEMQCAVVMFGGIISMMLYPDFTPIILIAVISIFAVSATIDRYKKRLKRYIKYCDKQYNKRGDN